MSNRISIIGNGDFVYALVEREIRDTDAVPTDNSDLVETITEWAWKHHSSTSGRFGGEVTFEYEGTWDDLVDSYYEDRNSDYNESRIG